MSEPILSQIFVKIQELETAQNKSLLVFDLDSTLFDVSHRTQAILQEFADLPEIKSEFPLESSLLKSAQVLIQDWGYAEALRRMNAGDPPQKLKEKLFHFWRTHFFSNPYLHFDRPVPGAVDFVNGVLEFKHTKVIYLTGRDQHRMGSGTKEVLEKWAFPVEHPQVELVLKPHKDMEDAQFKTEWFLQYPQIHKHQTWFFENEPVNIHHLRNHLEHVQVVFFESTHSRKAAVPEDLPSIRSFRHHREKA